MSDGSIWIHSAGNYRVTQNANGSASVFELVRGKPFHRMTFKMRMGSNKERAIRSANRLDKRDTEKAASL